MIVNIIHYYILVRIFHVVSVVQNLTYIFPSLAIYLTPIRNALCFRRFRKTFKKRVAMERKNEAKSFRMCAPRKRFCKGRVRSVNGKNAIDKSDRLKNEKRVFQAARRLLSVPGRRSFKGRDDGHDPFPSKIKPTVSANIQKGSIPVSANLPARIEKRREPMTVIIPRRKGLYCIQASFSKTNKEQSALGNNSRTRFCINKKIRLNLFYAYEYFQVNINSHIKLFCFQNQKTKKKW